MPPGIVTIRFHVPVLAPPPVTAVNSVGGTTLTLVATIAAEAYEIDANQVPGSTNQRCHVVAPPVGPVEVSTLPLASTATQRVADGDETDCMWVPAPSGGDPSIGPVARRSVQWPHGRRLAPVRGNVVAQGTSNPVPVLTNWLALPCDQPIKDAIAVTR